MIAIRTEEPRDFDAVRQVNERAFGQPGEAALVDALRAAGKATVSLVAEVESRLVGHILFSPVTVEENPAWTGSGLAPMAVLPEFQGRGVGTALARAGLDACRALGVPFAVVLGHPHYYPRFGFVPASRFGLHCEYGVPDDVFMAMELRPAALTGVGGLVCYQQEFRDL